MSPAYSLYKALDRNKPGTPETRRNANTFLPGYGPGQQRPASAILSADTKQVL